MGWFGEQIRDRKKKERILLSDSFEKLGYAVTGKRNSSPLQEGADIVDAVGRVLKHFGIREKELPFTEAVSVEKALDYLLMSSGIMYRNVVLEEGWHRDAIGAMLATLKEDGTIIALLPGAFGVCEYVDLKTGRKVRVTAKNEQTIRKEAICLYRPLPLRELRVRDLIAYLLGTFSAYDIGVYLLSAFLVVLAGLLLPRLNHILIGDVVSFGDQRLLGAVLGFLFFATIGSVLLTMIRQLLLQRIQGKLDISLQAACMMRVLSLPTSFFKQYSAGEVNQYLAYTNSLCGALVNAILSAGVIGAFSLVYLTQVFAYAPALVGASVVIVLATVGISLIVSLLQMPINREMLKVGAKERGLVLNLVGGIQTIRLTGAENRAFAKWMEMYTKEAALTYRKPLFLRLSGVFTSAIGLVGTMVIYYLAARSGVGVADYYAFNTAYGFITAAFAALAEIIVSTASVRPVLEVIRPLLSTAPEKQEEKTVVTGLSGNIELSHVTFRYEKDGPPILDDVSLSFASRKYVAVVGKTGCGKSTLFRLLLGFEKPDKGSILFDRKDSQTLDMGSVRRKIGTVLQDGHLFRGSIFENITVSAPWLTLREAWEAAEIAGIADDIRAMPMGMATVIQEGGGGISGGQRQRLMIARAVAPKPSVLLFDEATSALDNVTQKHIADALDRMRCTRIVIAHRLSTIRRCDRILVLDGGKIVEDGNYDGLIKKGGFFAELVKRQQTESG